MDNTQIYGGDKLWNPYFLPSLSHDFVSHLPEPCRGQERLGFLVVPLLPPPLHQTNNGLQHNIPQSRKQKAEETVRD